MNKIELERLREIIDGIGRERDMVARWRETPTPPIDNIDYSITPFPNSQPIFENVL